MSQFKEEVDYAEILRREGIELPAMIGDDASESVSVSEDDDRVDEEEEDTEDTQEATPAQGNAGVATKFSTRADMDEHGQTRADTHGHTRTWTRQRHGKRHSRRLYYGVARRYLIQ